MIPITITWECTECGARDFRSIMDTTPEACPACKNPVKDVVRQQVKMLKVHYHQAMRGHHPDVDGSTPYVKEGMVLR